MNVFVGKIGKSILFNPESWGAIGGDNEAPLYYENLFHRNPSIHFFIFGASDWARLKSSDKMRINKHGNVHAVWNAWPEFKRNTPASAQPLTGAEQTSTSDADVRFRLYLEHWLETTGIKMDCGVLFAGPTGTSNIVGKTCLMDTPGQLARPIQMLCRYAAPLLNYLNTEKPPYALIVNDPRYFPPVARDWFHPPSHIMSQFDEDIVLRRRTTYSDCALQSIKLKSKYAHVETIFLINKDRSIKQEVTLDSFFDDASDVPPGRDIKFMVVCNEGKPSRYNLLKKTILNDVKDVDIYGQWDERTIGDDSRFKGSLPFAELQGMLKRVKYTYCIPIKKGWVTAKFWEMVYNGIVPFLHPTYDEQNHLNAPEILRVETSKELFKRIEFLESHPEAYDTLLQNLQAMCKDEYYTGEYLNNTTLDLINDMTS